MCGLYKQICGECMGGSRGWLVVEREGERERERKRGGQRERGSEREREGGRERGRKREREGERVLKGVGRMGRESKRLWA